jgi:hypothetical protein
MAKPIFTTSREAMAFLRKIAEEYSGTKIEDVLAQFDTVEHSRVIPENRQVDVYDRDDLLHCEDCDIDEMNANLEVRNGGRLCDDCAASAHAEYRHQNAASWGNV